MSPACPACQSPRIHWILHRVHGRGTHASHRSLQWVCRDCGHQWEVPIEAPDPDPLGDPAPPA